MKLPSLNVDDKGQSYFGEVESADKDGKERKMPAAYWQLWETQPGHVADFQPVDAAKCVAMTGGKIEVTASNGERRYFNRGDVFLLQDVSGRGHTIRNVGFDASSAIIVTMKDIMTPSAA
jgi:uncharacterized cupin superfamily protein